MPKLYTVFSLVERITGWKSPIRYTWAEIPTDKVSTIQAMLTCPSEVAESLPIMDELKEKSILQLMDALAEVRVHFRDLYADSNNELDLSLSKPFREDRLLDGIDDNKFRRLFGGGFIVGTLSIACEAFVEDTLSTVA